MKIAIIIFAKILLIILPVLIAVAFLTLFERKVMAAIQRRKGPNVVGIWGLLQPFADGLKLLIKETIIPSRANRILFIAAPIITLFLSLISWAIMPLGLNIYYADVNLGVLYVFAVSSLGVYGVIISGWSSNSKYAFLGALRSAAQMIAYEVSIGLIIIVIVLFTGSLNLTDIVLGQTSIWFVVPLFPSFLLFFISSLAETNRPPFDLPEAEAELVSGYNVEYSAMGFALFFLGENVNIVLMCGLNVVLFFGGWLPLFGFLSFIPGYLWFSAKIVCLLFAFIWIRNTFPRYRYDQLMKLGWKIFLPLSLGWLCLMSIIIHLCF